MPGWTAIPPEVNAAQINAGDQGASWSAAAASWKSMHAEMVSAFAELGAIRDVMATSIKGATRAAALAELSTHQAYAAEMAMYALSMASKAGGGVGAWQTARSSMVPVPEVMEAKARAAAGPATSAVTGVMDASAMEAAQRYEQYRMVNGAAMEVYEEQALALAEPLKIPEMELPEPGGWGNFAPTHPGVAGAAGGMRQAAGAAGRLAGRAGQYAQQAAPVINQAGSTAARATSQAASAGPQAASQAASAGSQAARGATTPATQAASSVGHAAQGLGSSAGRLGSAAGSPLSSAANNPLAAAMNQAYNTPGPNGVLPNGLGSPVPGAFAPLANHPHGGVPLDKFSGSRYHPFGAPSAGHAGGLGSRAGGSGGAGGGLGRYATPGVPLAAMTGTGTAGALGPAITGSGAGVFKPNTTGLGVPISEANRAAQQPRMGAGMMGAGRGRNDKSSSRTTEQLVEKRTVIDPVAERERQRAEAERFF